jgi:hypothetical protein
MVNPLKHSGYFMKAALEFSSRTLNFEISGLSEMLVTMYQIKWCHIPEDSNIYNHCHTNHDVHPSDGFLLNLIYLNNRFIVFGVGVLTKGYLLIFFHYSRRKKVKLI